MSPYVSENVWHCAVDKTCQLVIGWSISNDFLYQMNNEIFMFPKYSYELSYDIIYKKVC